MSQNTPDDPLAPRDVTILRPRPGVGRKPATPAPPQSPPPVQPSVQPQPAAYAPAIPPAQPPAPPPAQFATPAAFADSIAQLPGVAVNPLVQAAVPLLLLAGRLRGQIAPADVEGLRRQAMQEIGAFEERARRAQIPPEDLLAARYALCTVVDEAVLNTPWGAQGGWASQSLLVTFHREASGGEKFFQILERVSNEPQRYLALLELLYVCLALGFEGKYRLDPQGAARLTEIRQNLYRRVGGLRDSVEPELSPRWKGVEDRRNAVLRFVPLWVVAAACAVILLGGYLYFDSKLRAQADPVNATLAGVGLESFDAPAASNAPSGLRELLSAQISSGQIYFDEAGGRTVITLAVPDLFASGSTQVNQRHTSLVHEIGAALHQVPGRIVVIGHTDNQPLRSLRFKDNYELSRARAVQVADLLMRDIHNGGRIETAGKGALEPRFEPADLPENRARNRRVEIIHRRDG
ncbi:MAG TPA: type IVB secretion system protein IcmH/DotU [Steroidobacter sp.]|uniref:type IVB secretion system protein IcmH/DotU n=1 Tax=Steroidobacter sp. TaxID=1978227 RepID=UPI002ED92CF4